MLPEFEHEPFGESFSSLFPSAAAAAEEAKEMEETQRLLKLLEQLEASYPPESDEGVRKGVHERFRAIDSDGRIFNNDPSPSVNRNKVHTLDDLPKETLTDALFGPPEVVEPPVRLEAGLRLKDKKKVYTVSLPEDRSMSLSWSGINPGVMTAVFLLLCLAFLCATRAGLRSLRGGVSRRYKSSKMHTEREITLRVNQEMQRQMQEMRRQMQEMQRQMQRQARVGVTQADFY